MLDKSLKGFACASVYLLRIINAFHHVQFTSTRERIYVNPKENTFLVYRTTDKSQQKEKGQLLLFSTLKP